MNQSYKECPRCRTAAPLQAGVCPCGHVFRTQFAVPVDDRTQVFSPQGERIPEHRAPLAPLPPEAPQAYQQPYPPPAPPARPLPDLISLLAFIVSLLSLFTWGGLLGSAAVILAVIGLYRLHQYPHLHGAGVAWAGLVIGILSVCFALAATVAPAYSGSGMAP